MLSNYQQAETHYGDTALSVHDRISDLNNRAYRLAPAVAESAMDSGCTDGPGTYRKEYQALGPRQRKAWDMIAEAYGWNAISDNPGRLAEAEQCERDGIAYKIEYASYSEADEAGDFGGYEVTVTEAPARPAVRAELPRCTTCHRSAHTSGWQGHYFTGPGQAPAAAPAPEYYVILTGFRAPANRPASRWTYRPGHAGAAFGEALVNAIHLAATDSAGRRFDICHADTEGQVLIVTVAADGGLTWPRH